MELIFLLFLQVDSDLRPGLIMICFRTVVDKNYGQRTASRLDGSFPKVVFRLNR